MTPDPLNIAITPADQRRAAELAEACVRSDADQVGEHLAGLLRVGPTRTLAAAAVLARNLAAALVTAHGRDVALRVLESTRLDAAMADEGQP